MRAQTPAQVKNRAICERCHHPGKMHGFGGCRGKRELCEHKCKGFTLRELKEKE